MISSSEKPLISIIITTFLRPTFLRRAINSVLAQSYYNFEIIVVDDNNKESTEGKQTQELMKNFCDKRIHYVMHDRNLGASFARNTGVAHSRGEYIAFLDDDDEYLPDKLLRQIEVAIKYKTSNGVVVFCGFEVVGNKRLDKSKWCRKTKYELFFPKKTELFAGNFIGSNSFVLFDRGSFYKVGGYDVALSSSQDWDFYLKLTEIDVFFVGIPDVLVRYYAFDAPDSITGSKEKRLQGFFEVEKKHALFASELGPSVFLSFYRYLYRRCMSLDIGAGTGYLIKVITLTKSVKDLNGLLKDFLYFLVYFIFHCYSFLSRAFR